MKFIPREWLIGLCAVAAFSQAAESVKLPHIPVSFELEKRSTNADYDLNWADVPTSEAKTFIPEMKCDLSKQYFEVAKRPGFKTSVEESDPLLKPDDLGTQGVLPWPRLVGYWQNWQEGLYFNAIRIQERDTNGDPLDFMVLKIYSLCTDDLLAEASVQIKNPELKRTLTVPTLSYSLKVGAEQLSFRVLNFANHPQTDTLEVELRYVDPSTKEPKRSSMKIFRFL